MQHLQQPRAGVKFQFFDSSFQKFSYCLLFSTSTDSFISSFFIDVNTNLLGQKGIKFKLEWTILKLPFHHESLSHHIFSRQEGLALDQGWLQGCPLSITWAYFMIHIQRRNRSLLTMKLGCSQSASPLISAWKTSSTNTTFPFFLISTQQQSKILSEII